MLVKDCKTLESVVLELKSTLADGLIRKIKLLPPNFIQHPVETFFAVKLPVCREYTSDYLKLRQEQFHGTVQGQIDRDSLALNYRKTQIKSIQSIFSGESPEILCPEAILPPEMDKIFNPQFFRLIQEQKNIPGHQNDFQVKIMAGKRGAYAHLHFDWDLKINFFLQLYGQKKIVLFPASQGRLLKGFINQSSIFLENLPPDMRVRLIKSMGGIEIVICPGEAMIIPPFYWHYVEYLDDAVSLSIRCFSKKYNEFKLDELYKTWKFPLLIQHFKDSPKELLSELARIQKILSGSLLSGKKFLEIEKIYHEILAPTDYLRGGLTLFDDLEEEFYYSRRSLSEKKKSQLGTLIASKELNKRFTMNLGGLKQ